MNDKHWCPLCLGIAVVAGKWTHCLECMKLVNPRDLIDGVEAMRRRRMRKLIGISFWVSVATLLLGWALL